MRALCLPSLLTALIVQVQASTFQSATLPPFLAHVTEAQLQAATVYATRQHEQAVATALAHYDTDAVPAVDRALDQPLATFSIDAPGTLPDFANELERKVHVTNPPLLSTDECRQVIFNAETYFANKNADGAWDMQQSGQYQVAGFWIKNIPAVQDWFVTTVKQRLFVLLAQTFPDFCRTADDLCVDNAYLFKYTPVTGRRTDVHTDSGCLSFTIALNPLDEYVGGGTWFQGLQTTDNTDNGNPSVLEMTQGQVTIRPGGVKHCGHAVTHGTRYIIGGFCLHRRKPEIVRQLLIRNADLTDDEHVRMLEAAVVLNPACDIPYNVLGNQYDKMGDTERARQTWEYCLEHVHPLSGEVAYSLGTLYMAQGEFAKARQCFSTCLQVDEADVDAMMGLAQACAGLRDTAGELQQLQAIVATPGASTSVAASAYCNLGVLKEGQDVEIHYYRKSIELDGTKFAPQYSLACAYASRQKWGPAIDTFRQALAVVDTPDHEWQALQALYTATVKQVQSDPNPPQSREDMMDRFQSLMGAKNYQRVTELAKVRQ